MIHDSLRRKFLAVALLAASAVVAGSASARELAHELRRDLADLSAVASAKAEAAFGRKGAQQPAPPAPPPQQPSTVGVTISGDPGAQTRIAVPDLLALSSDRETQDAARTIAQVLWDDLQYEREFYMIPRDTYKSVPPAGSIDTVPYERWRELGADNVIIGSVQRMATGIRVELRLYNVRAQQIILGKEYTGSAANPRLYAHTMSDEIHQSQ